MLIHCTCFQLQLRRHFATSKAVCTIDQYKNYGTYKWSNCFFCNLLVQLCFACSNTKTCKYSDDARYFTDFSAGSFDLHSIFQNCNENNIFFLRDVVVPALRNMWKSAFLCLAGCLSAPFSRSPKLAQLRYESSTLILYKELSSPIFQSLSVSEWVRHR